MVPVLPHTYFIMTKTHETKQQMKMFQNNKKFHNLILGGKAENLFSFLRVRKMNLADVENMNKMQ